MSAAQISSSCPNGTIITMDAWIDPSNSEKYLELCRPIAAEFRKYPENLFAAISVDPTDAGHIRIVHGWTKDSAWFFETLVKGKECVQRFTAESSSMWIKPRVIEHFDRYVEE